MKKQISVNLTKGELSELLVTARAGNFNDWEFYQNENGEHLLDNGEERLNNWKSAINKICEALYLEKHPNRNPRRKTK